MDYDYISCGLHRAGGPRAPWKARAPHVLHLYPPNFRYWDDTRQARGEYHGGWILVSGGEAAGLNSFLLPPHGYARFEDPDNRLGGLLERIALMAARDGEAVFWECQSMLCETIALLGHARRVNEETYRLVSAGERRVSTFADRVERLLAANLSEPLPVSAIAHQFAMSESALYRKIHAEANETVTQMYARLRIAEAKRLLLQGETLKEISERTGYCDAFHLSTTFKRVEGVSPREFKKMMK